MGTRKLEWRWIFDAITAFSILVGLTLGIIELRQLGDAQESQTLMVLYQTLQDPDQVRGRELLMQLPDGLSPDSAERIMAGPDGPLIRQALLAFEGMGVMVYRGDVSIEWVDELFYINVVTAWRKMEAGVVARRVRTGDPGIMEWVQWLAERLEERSEKAGRTGAYDLYRNWKPPG